MRGLLKTASMEDYQHQVHNPAPPTSTDQNTDVTRTSSEDHTGVDVATRGSQCSRDQWRSPELGGKDQNRGFKKKDKDHMEFVCELYEAQVARGRHFVHELTSEVNSRMKCMTKITAMPGTRTTVADLCMFGLAACDEGGAGFVKASVRTVTTHRPCSCWLKQSGIWVRQVARAMEEQLRGNQQELETGELKKKAKDAERIRVTVHESDKNKKNGSRAR